MKPITIFGLPGSGSSRVGMEVATLFRCGFFSTGNRFRQLAIERGVTTAELGRIATTDPAIDQYIDVEHVDGLIKNHKLFVLDSRLAWQRKEFFSVCLYASNDVRRRRVAERDHCSLLEAGEDIAKRTKVDRDRFLKKYGVDINPPGGFGYPHHNFDLIINTTSTDVAVVASVIYGMASGSNR